MQLQELRCAIKQVRSMRVLRNGNQERSSEPHGNHSGLNTDLLYVFYMRLNPAEKTENL